MLRNNEIDTVDFIVIMYTWNRNIKLSQEFEYLRKNFKKILCKHTKFCKFGALKNQKPKINLGVQNKIPNRYWIRILYQ